MKAARDNFCPAPECYSSFQTVDGLHDHIDTKHGGKSLNRLRKEADEYYGGNND